MFNSVSVGSVVKRLKRRARDQHGLGSKPTRVILLCPWERRFRALSPACGLGKHFKITVISLLNYKRIAISWHLRKQIGVIAYPMYYRLRRFPASQEDKYRGKINK